MTLPNLVKTYRKQNNLTMQEFADRCGLSKAYISMLEKGKHPQNATNLRPNIETLDKLAKGMGMSFDDFAMVLKGETVVTVNDDVPEQFKKYMSDDLITIVNAWEKLSDADKQIIKIIAEKYK